MKGEGIVRKLDDLGRVVIPKEMRNLLNVNEGDNVIITREDNYVLITKYCETCLFCGGRKGISRYKGIFICEKCMEKIESKIQ